VGTGRGWGLTQWGRGGDGDGDRDRDNGDGWGWGQKFLSPCSSLARTPSDNYSAHDSRARIVRGLGWVGLDWIGWVEVFQFLVGWVGFIEINSKGSL